MLGDGWVDRDLVFTTGHGTAIEPHNLFDHFKAALQTAGLPAIRFHDLRHSCASILLAQNVHPRVIMEILGHSEIGTTMNLYAHVIPEVQESAMQLLSQALAPKAKLAQIDYTRYDAEGTLIDSGTLEREGELALDGTTFTQRMDTQRTVDRAGWAGRGARVSMWESGVIYASNVTTNFSGQVSGQLRKALNGHCHSGLSDALKVVTQEGISNPNTQFRRLVLYPLSYWALTDIV